MKQLILDCVVARHYMEEKIPPQGEEETGQNETHLFTWPASDPSLNPITMIFGAKTCEGTPCKHTI